MKRCLKIIIVVVLIIIGITALDTLQAIVFKQSPLLSRRENIDDSFVDKGIIIDTFYCVKDQDIVTVSWHLKTAKFSCPKNIVVDNKVNDELENNNQSTGDSMVEISDDELVKILDYIPNAIIDLKYATTDNFTGQIIYENSDALLRYGTIKKLMKVQDELNRNGYTLIIWDAYRPVAAQFKLWDIYPDSKYVSDPNKGYSSHSRGNTLDLTIIKLDGTSVEMPTGFDDFTTKADRNYEDVSAEAKKNAEFLENIMKTYGFKGYSGEWWHYSDEIKYDVIK
ncbi:MAG: hypothetical protein E7161_01270 [Firmicutes bacterium]|nr:hypothetical protein [Bacillota bacterium]